MEQSKVVADCLFGLARARIACVFRVHECLYVFIWPLDLISTINIALKRSYDAIWSFWVCFALGKVVWRACECFLSVLSLTKTSIL